MLDGISLQALSLPLAILQGIERRIHKLQQERQEKTVSEINSHAVGLSFRSKRYRVQPVPLKGIQRRSEPSIELKGAEAGFTSNEASYDQQVA